MTKEIALSLLKAYSNIVYENNSETESLICVAGMPDRWQGGSEKKAMRWLGFAQGVMFATGMFSLEELKQHSRNGFVIKKN